MKKLASVLVLGLAVSGIGGCGDDAPVPRPEAGVGDGGTKVGDGGGGTDADGGGNGAEGGSVGNLDAGTGNTLDAASVPDLAPDAGGGGTADTQVGADGAGPLDGPVVVGVADGGGWWMVGRWSTLSMQQRMWTVRRQSTPRRWKTVRGWWRGGLAVRVVG